MSQDIEMNKNKNVARFIIPYRLPGLNEIIAEAKKHPMKYSSFKRLWTSDVGGWIIASKIPVFVRPVGLQIRWIEPNAKRDPDNIRAGIKFLLDALVQTGKIKNDSREWIKSITDEFPESDKDNSRVEVLITD